MLFVLNNIYLVCENKSITITELKCDHFHSLSLKLHHFYAFPFPFLGLVQWIVEFFECALVMVTILYCFYSVKFCTLGCVGCDGNDGA